MSVHFPTIDPADLEELKSKSTANKYIVTKFLQAYDLAKSVVPTLASAADARENALTNASELTDEHSVALVKMNEEVEAAVKAAQEKVAAHIASLRERQVAAQNEYVERMVNSSSTPEEAAAAAEMYDAVRADLVSTSKAFKGESKVLDVSWPTAAQLVTGKSAARPSAKNEGSIRPSFSEITINGTEIEAPFTLGHVKTVLGVADYSLVVDAFISAAGTDDTSKLADGHVYSFVIPLNGVENKVAARFMRREGGPGRTKKVNSEVQNVLDNNANADLDNNAGEYDETVAI